MAAALVTATPSRAASPIELPVAVPAKLRALVRARMHMEKPPRRAWESRFEIETKDGYDLAVIGVQGVVAVVVIRAPDAAAAEWAPRKGGTLTGYVAHGTVTPHRLQASFGPFGEIAVRFRPSGRTVNSPPRRRCKGPDRYTIRPGVFVGSFHFTGEHRYIQVRAHRAKGRIRRPLGLRCAGPPNRSRAATRGRPVSDLPAFPFGALQAGWREATASTELLALRFGGDVLYLASTEESLGSVAEIRYAATIGSARTFGVNDTLTSAKLQPPWPFSGAGRYTAFADGSRTWTGGLRAAFPGAGRLPLTGPRFRVLLESSF